LSFGIGLSVAGVASVAFIFAFNAKIALFYNIGNSYICPKHAFF
jgi:hypothetical protein